MLTRLPANLLLLFLAAAMMLACKKPEGRGPDGDEVASKGAAPTDRAGGASADGPAAQPAEADQSAHPAEPNQPAGHDSPAEPAQAEPNQPAHPAEPAGGEPPATEPSAGDGQNENKPPTNLKVLPPSWTAAQVNDYMKEQVARGLGVKCVFCHQKEDYAADGNEHKQVARSMIRMTDALDVQFFQGKRLLTCFTCHHGKEEVTSSASFGPDDM